MCRNGLISLPVCPSGVIRTTVTLDREAVPSYWLSAYVTDLGTEPLASWTHVFLEVLDVNDNPPELSQPVYYASVPENAAKARQVLQVHATDADSSSEGKLSFHMLESQRTNFDIQPKTGNNMLQYFVQNTDLGWIKYHPILSKRPLSLK